MDVLIVDDDPELLDLLTQALRGDGHQVSRAASAEAARALMRGRGFGVVVLDVMLGDGSGLDLCRQWRRAGRDEAVLILSARGAVDARVDGLEAGADDYLAKPFATRELLARVRALGRRRGLQAPPMVELGKVALRFDRRQALVAGVEVPVTPREWEILTVLAAASGRVVPYSELLECAWGEATPGARASLDVLVSRLRRKLGGSTAAPLTTVRGLGLALRAAP